MAKHFLAEHIELRDPPLLKRSELGLVLFSAHIGANAERSTPSSPLKATWKFKMKRIVNSAINTPQQLRRAIASLSRASPMTDRFTRQWRRGQKESGQRERARVWYETQQEHWLGWLGAYVGPGAYRRKKWDRSAEFVYNHVVNPLMLVYLAEAASIDRALIAKATKEALANQSTMSSMSSAIRRIIPWSIVEEALGVRGVRD